MCGCDCECSEGMTRKGLYNGAFASGTCRWREKDKIHRKRGKALEPATEMVGLILVNVSTHLT